MEAGEVGLGESETHKEAGRKPENRGEKQRRIVKPNTPHGG